MAETGYFRGEGGSIFVMDLPLQKVMQQKLIKGYLHRVDAEGTPYVEPVETGDSGAERPTRPAQSATKAEWVGYAVRAHGTAPDDAEAMTKTDLIERYGKEG